MWPESMFSQPGVHRHLNDGVHMYRPLWCKPVFSQSAVHSPPQRRSSHVQAPVMQTRVQPISSALTTSTTEFTCTGPCYTNPCNSEETCVPTSPTEHRCDPGKKTHIKDVKPNEDKRENDVSCKWKHLHNILKVHSHTKQKWRWRFLTWR